MTDAKIRKMILKRIKDNAEKDMKVSEAIYLRPLQRVRIAYKILRGEDLRLKL